MLAFIDTKIIQDSNFIIDYMIILIQTKILNNSKKFIKNLKEVHSKKIYIKLITLERCKGQIGYMIKQSINITKLPKEIYDNYFKNFPSSTISPKHFIDPESCMSEKL